MDRKQIYEKRIKLLKNKTLENNDCILIFNEKNIYYLSGFYGKNSSSCLLITGKKKNYLIVNFIFYEDACDSVRSDSIEVVLSDKKNKKLFEILKDLNIKEITIESSSLSYNEFINIQEKLSGESIYVKAIEYPLSEFRIIKDEYEQSIMKRNCALTEKCLNFLINKPLFWFRELTEAELAIEIERFFIKDRASYKSFDFVIASNENSSKPHYVAGDNKISDGILLMDFGIVSNNYCSDITRTLFIGKSKEKDIQKKFIDIYKIVKEAQEAAICCCREGLLASELDKVARDFISKYGYGNNFGHSLGHGVGLSVHEPPFINSENNQILKESMIITIEPGIYIKGFGGVRIEDMVIVRKKECERLYKNSKEMIVINK